MRRFRLAAPVALAATFLAPLSAASFDLPRDALWFTIQSCALAQRTSGSPFPCRALQGGAEGFAILHVPGSAAHFLVTPVQSVIGLESPPSRAHLTLGAWTAALRLRQHVASARGLRPGDVALSINPKRARGQDQLHIHVDCADPEWASRIRAYAGRIGPRWARLPAPVDGIVFWARQVTETGARLEDPFTSLRELPVSRIDPGNVVFAAIGLEPDGRDLIETATQTAGTSAEDALDDRCDGPR